MLVVVESVDSIGGQAVRAGPGELLRGLAGSVGVDRRHGSRKDG